MKKTCILTSIVMLFSALMFTAYAMADQHFPAKNWKPQTDPIANPYSETGGKISLWGGGYPKSFNNYLDNNSTSAELFGTLFSSLLSMNPMTMEFEPSIAKKWTISDDKLTFTFIIDSKARWSDNSPITAYDVKWTYDAIMDPKNLTGPSKVSMERFFPPKVIDQSTIVFRAKTVHWKNLLALGGFNIMCKKAYADKDFNKINFEFPVVSGPFHLGRIVENQLVELVKRDDWWQKDDIRFKNIFNFKTIAFKFYADRDNAFEEYKKGLMDLYPVYTARFWVFQAQGEPYDKNWIIKQKVYNQKPVGFQGFAMNMRHPPFDDVRVRKAMALLLDRRKLNQTMMYDQYYLHRSYWEDLYSKAHPCPNPIIEMDKEKARQLLHQAGWNVNPNTGYLEKNGKVFSFKFLSREASTEKFLVLYAEYLKSVGINMEIDKKDFAGWAKDMDEFNFQMTWAAWGASIFKDPESMWSSAEAKRIGGNNITGFENKEVDKLIEAQKVIFDIQKRNEILRKIDAILYKQYPYVLLWNLNYTRLLYWNKFGTPDTVLSKYGSESDSIAYWSMDFNALADLEDAMKNKTALMQKPPVIYFDKVFVPNPGGPTKAQPLK